MDFLQIDELIELLGQCATDPECKSVLLTGLGGTFSHGLDLSLLAYDQAPEKQRKSAESLAASVRRLVRYLLDYPKVGIFSHVQVCFKKYISRLLSRMDFCAFGTKQQGCFGFKFGAK